MATFVLSDAHLFQTYLEWYDSVKDFDRAVRECQETGADAYILAGDVFDYKTTNTSYLRHYRGEEHLVELRNLFLSLDAPVYALRGNHEKQVVLESMEQTVENFHYQEGRQWTTLDGRDVLLLDTNYRTEGYRDEIVGEFEDIAVEAEDRSRPVLVMHETLGDFDTTLPEGAIEAIADRFETVLNGHMHRKKRGVRGFSNVVNLPALQPSRLPRGSYWTERYQWEDGETEHESRDSPFGYVSLESDGSDLKFHHFNPTRNVVEVTFDFTGVSLADARKRFEQLLDELNSRDDRDELMVYPAVEGQIAFSSILLDDITDEFPDLFTTDIKSEDAEKVPPELVETDTATSIVSEEDLQSELLAAVPDMVEQLEEDGVDADRETVTGVVEHVTGADSEIFAGNRRTIANAIRDFVESNTEASDEELPDNFATHLKDLAEEVKQ